MLTEGVWAELEMKICFLKTLWKKIIEKLATLSKIGFSIECSVAEFYSDFPSHVSILPFE